MKKLVLFALISGAVFIGCKKDKGPKTITETPIHTTVSKASIVDNLYIVNNGTWEMGLKFYSSRDGYITKLGAKTAEKGNFRISLWDFTSKNLIAATTVGVTDTVNFTYNSVSPIPITANERYVISFNNVDNGVNKKYYFHEKKPGNQEVQFPFTAGSITFEAAVEERSATPVFPTKVKNPYNLLGSCDFHFEYKE